MKHKIQNRVTLSLCCCCCCCRCVHCTTKKLFRFRTVLSSRVQQYRLFPPSVRAGRPARTPSVANKQAPKTDAKHGDGDGDGHQSKPKTHSKGVRCCGQNTQATPGVPRLPRDSLQRGQNAASCEVRLSSPTRGRSTRLIPRWPGLQGSDVETTRRQAGAKAGTRQKTQKPVTDVRIHAHVDTEGACQGCRKTQTWGF